MALPLRPQVREVGGARKPSSVLSRQESHW